MNEDSDADADASADAPCDAPLPPGRDPAASPEVRHEAYLVPGFDAVARMLCAALHVPLVALVLVEGGTFFFAPGSSKLPAVSGQLQDLLLSAIARDASREELDVHEHAGAEADGASTPLRFFASVPVHTLTHRHVAALCVIDFDPRASLSEADRVMLADAATLAGAAVVLRSYIRRVDPVTQLPHRNAFFEDLRARAEGGARSLAIVAIEVAPASRFNAFIRAMGHQYADALVRLVAMRIQEWMAQDMCLYQVGVTRFALLLADTLAFADSASFDRLVARLREPFDCQGIPLTIQPGVGLLEMPASKLTTGDALRLVMSASHTAQQSVRGWSHYEQAQDELHQQEFFLVTELSEALNNPASVAANELELHFQPRVDLRSGRCVAVEALMRWHHPSLGWVSPARFIPLVEQAGLMRCLTDWVFQRGLQQLSSWLRDGLDIHLSMNVSSTDFEADLVPRLLLAAEHFHVPLRYIELELTEDTFMHNSEAVQQRLAQLSELGVSIAIDDFGTGYSNLAYMRKLPASTLKIDQSFVASIDESADDEMIVRCIAGMARSLGFRVVVEGVETASIYRTIRDMGCDEIQGYFIARPMPGRDLAPWLARFEADGIVEGDAL
ncbi:MAG: GGDEF domain-containing protein [Proteobacteria bacterium]|nr:GGDEF domain-containing protein [Pseudomonadota bacterium]